MENVRLKILLILILIINTKHAMPIEGTSLLSNNYSNSFFSNNYETNTTEFNILNLPVDTESDTLIVADRDESENLDPGGEIKEGDKEKHSPAHADEIIDAEHDRDVNMAKNVKDKKKVAVLEIAEADADDFRKQLNISSSVLDDIMEAETGRDETLTDIMFAPEDPPQFAFLIAQNLKLSFNSTREFLLNVNASDHFKDLDNISESGRKIDYVELVAVMKPTQNSSSYSNETIDELENDSPDTRFTDVQTLFLACFATLLPLLLALLALLIIRCLCRRFCPQCARVPDDASSASDVSDVEKQDLSQEEYKAESNGTTPHPAGGSVLPAPPPPATNGSIITMTLKNNHLIVETEERNDIKNGRETKMKYSPESDGIFVVEVQQSAPYRSSSKSHSPPHNSISSNQHALIHRAPEDTITAEEIVEIDEIKYGNNLPIDKKRPLALSNTGLSISDLSMSSIGSHNPSYSYGSQTGYEQGPFGYPVYPGYDVPEPSNDDAIEHDNSREPLLSKTPTDPDKPVVTAAIFKQDSIIGNDIFQGPGYCIEGSTDGPLLSDVQAREVSLHQLHDKLDTAHENIQAVVVKDETPKKHLNRADSLPPRLEEEIKASSATEDTNLKTIGEDEEKIINEVTKGKRTSLPVIVTTGLYETVPDVIPNSSPKFEILKNASSPLEGIFPLPPPMITITEEYDNSGYQNDMDTQGS